MRIMLTGGGTGGHFYPLMSVAEVLRQDASKPHLYYIGPSPYSKEQLDILNIDYVYCPAGKLRRYWSWQNFFDLFRTFFGLLVAICKLYYIYPDVVFSKGSYTAVPVIIAARLLRIPVVIHESDSVPGKANQLAVKYAQYIAISYPEVARFFPKEKTALTGIPLRPEIKHFIPDPLGSLGIPKDKPLIYVTGGSQGAERLNSLILHSLEELLPHYRIFHQAGDSNVASLRQTAQSLLENTDWADNYYLEGNIPAETVSALMQGASLVITRAGSTTIFEIAYLGKPSIIVPIPEDVSRDQRTNAYTYARTGAATVLEESNLTDDLLASTIHSIIASPEQQANMSVAARQFFVPDAAPKIALALVAIGKEHEQ